MNYNIDFEATALDGAKILDIQGNWRRRRCICIPIDNEAGTVTTPDNLKGAVADVRRVFIHLRAAEGGARPHSPSEAQLLTRRAGRHDA